MFLDILIVVVALGYALLCGVIAGTLAEHRGRTYRGFFVLAFFFGVIGIVVAWLTPPTALVSRPPRREPLPDLERPVIGWKCANADCSAFGELTDRELCVRCAEPTAPVYAEPKPDVTGPPPPGRLLRFSLPRR